MAEQLLIDDHDFKTILYGMVKGGIAINTQGQIIRFNKRAESIFGYTGHEVEGRNVSILMSGHERQQHDKHIERYLATNEPHIIGTDRNVTGRRKNGEHFPLNISVIERRLGIPEEVIFIASCQDITYQKELDESARIEKLLTSQTDQILSDSRELNSLLGEVKAYADLIIERSFNDPSLLHLANSIQRKAKQGVKVTHKLSMSAGDIPIKKESVDVNRVLNRNLKKIANKSSGGIQVKMSLAGDLWPVEVDKDCLENVIFNLTANAQNAMVDGGVLEFSTSNHDINSLQSLLLALPKGEYVELKITDTGQDYVDGFILRIFDPHFSIVADENPASCPGLSQIYSLTNAAGGGLKIMSNSLTGNILSIYLPRYFPAKDLS